VEIVVLLLDYLFTKRCMANVNVTIGTVVLCTK
jgi:hypothetical protein